MDLLQRVLHKLEWSGTAHFQLYTRPKCPVCSGIKPSEYPDKKLKYGHEPDCELAQLIEGFREALMKPEDIPVDIVEAACVAFWNHGASRDEWGYLTIMRDPLVPRTREAMRAALAAAYERVLVAGVEPRIPLDWEETLTGILTKGKDV